MIQFQRLCSRVIQIPVLVLLVGLNAICFGQEPTKEKVNVARTAEPEWVDPLKVDLDAKAPKEAGDGGIWNLLIDSQFDAASHTRYGHYAYRFLSESGVQEYSERSIGFDPAYQTLSLHRLRIHRDGKVIDRLPVQEIRTLDRESGHENQLYDGQLTTILLLKDIRVGDVLEYAYSIKGQNPLFGDHFSKTQRWSWGITIHHMRYRLLWDRAELPLIRMQNFDQKPIISKTPKGHEIVWEQRDTKPVFEESGLPDDFTPYAWLEISDYRSWDDVRQWARPLYQFPDSLPPELKEKVEEIRLLPNEEEQILAALRFVQDSIRYVGSFMGEHSHRPYQVDTIMNRRFGDCKDKTLILVTMLRKLGIKADPALVETDFLKEISKWLPSPFDFDHVVTRVISEGKVYWIDPTRSFQRGNSLEKIYFPDYGVALVLDESKEGLETIKSPGFLNGKTKILEVFVLKDYQGEASLKVETEFFGGDADLMRAYFSRNSRETIKDTYLDFYAGDYPGVSADGDIIGKDNQDENRYTVTESYIIKDFWTKDESDTYWDGNFFQRSIYDELDAPKRSKRKMPFAISYPENVEHSVKIVLPSKWADEEDVVEKIENPAFDFSYKTVSKGNTTNLVCHYVSKKATIPPEEIAKFVKQTDQAKDLIGYHVNIRDSYREIDAKDLSTDVDIEDQIDIEDEPYQPNWLANIILFGTFVFGVLAAVALYFWNPPAREPFRAVVLGRLGGNFVGREGWMVLVAIGLFVRPIYGILALVGSFPDLELSVWNSVTTSGNEFYHPLWGFSILGEAMCNAFLLPLEILQIVLYIRLRTSFPKLVIAEFLYLIIQLSVFGSLYQILPGIDETVKSEAVSEIIKIVFTSAIWIPYLLVSRRVRNTFVKRRGKILEPPPLPLS